MACEYIEIIVDGLEALFLPSGYWELTMTILQKITFLILILSNRSSLCAALELGQLAGAFSEILVSLIGKTGAEIVTTQESAVSQAFADPTGFDSMTGNELVAAVEKAVAGLQDALESSANVKFDTDPDKSIKKRNSIFNYANVDTKTIQDTKLSAEIADIQKSIKQLYTISDSRKKLTSQGRTTLKNLPNKLAQYKKITEEQTERRTQIKQNYETALDTKKEKSVKEDAKRQLKKLLGDYAPLEGIVNSLANLITSIKEELRAFTKSTVSSHIEDTLIKQLTEIASRPTYSFTKEELAQKIADKATPQGDKSLYKQMLTNLEATDALLADAWQAIEATKKQLADGGQRINNIYRLVVDMRNKVTQNAPNAQQYMNNSDFKSVPTTIKNIFSNKLGDLAKSKGTEEIFRGGSQFGDASTTDPKKFTQAEITAIQKIPDDMLTLAGQSVDAVTESQEANLEELIRRQELVAPADGAKSRATFDTIKAIRTELKKQKLTGDARKQYVETNGASLSREIQEALAGESEWD